MLLIVGHWELCFNNLLLTSFFLLFCLQIHIVHNVNNDKPRGYAFIEYEHERDMHGMYPKIEYKYNSNESLNPKLTIGKYLGRA